MYQNPQSIEYEMFKILRGNILFPAEGEPPRSILITSALPSEGKSFVAANLAVSIAQNINEHVLLMDCDIRRPCIHTIFGYSEAPGLTEFLNQRASLTDVLLKTSVKKLTLLPAGNPPKNPAELLSSKEMTSLMDEVKQRYPDRHIIIDSPPPQLTAETNAIARRVDGVILVVKYGRTPRDMVAEMIESIGREKVLGVVMNWFDLRASSYYGYGKYSKYGKYYRS
jgi:exopolysaccharide/PEP-CTERM locus tyrosine autokinase